MTRLDGAFAKLDRADEHIEALTETIELWGSKKPYTVAREDNAQMTERRYDLVFTDVPDPNRWGVVLGDAVHNLRSALDHIAWQAAGGDGIAPDGTEFPVFKDEGLFRDSGRGGGQWKARGIHEPSYRALIEKAQPWANPKGHDTDEIWIVHELDRVDKHRVLTPILLLPLGFGAAQIEVVHIHGLTTPPQPPIIVQHPMRFADRTEAFSVISSTPFVDVKVNTHIYVGIGLELDGVHLGGTHDVLDKAAQRVRFVAEQFRDAGL